ncbi:MAG: tetratricopeptide repeat protein, partial [Bernardetiaceae bacterium]|nr:tetratricopeptide repeat protein [Bernardetiaceae bacterium]
MKNITILLFLLIITSTNIKAQDNAQKEWETLIQVSANHIKQKNYTEAIAQLDNALDIAKNKLGKQSQAHGQTLYVLGYTYFLMEKYAEAETQLLQAEQNTNVFGSDRANTLYYIANIALLYHKDKNRAEQYYQQALAVYKETYYQSQPQSYAIVCNQVAMELFNAKHFDIAEKYFKESLNIFELHENLNPKDQRTILESLFTLYYAKKEDLEQALIYLEKLRALEAKHNSKLSEHYMNCVDKSIEILFSRSEYQRAIPILEERREIYASTLGKDHIGYSTACNDLGYAYYQLQNYQQALPYYKEALKIREKAGEEFIAHYALTANNIITLYTEQYLYEDAERLHFELKSKRKQVLGKMHADYAESCDNLGRLYLKKSLFDEAKIFISEGKDIREKVLGKQHPDYATSCNNLALLYQNQGLYA